MTNARHVLIVEDLLEYSTWLQRTLLEAWPDTVIHTAANIATARAWLNSPPTGFGLALIDLSLPDGNGLELIAGMAGHQPPVRVVVTTIFDDDTHLFSALAAGADGYLLKGMSAQQLMAHLEAIQNGTPPISPAIARRMLDYFRQASPLASPTMAAPTELTPLTPRELEVLRYIGRGLRVAETARLLELTENTVAGYVKSLYRKLNVSSRAEAALEAARRGLV